MELKKTTVQEANEQLSDLNKLLTTMNEHKARFAKTIDDKALKEIKKIFEVGRSPAIATAN